MKYFIILFLLLIVSCTENKVSNDIKPIIIPQETQRVQENIEQAEQGDAFFENLKGNVYIKRNTELDWIDADLKKQLYFKDWIKTGDKSTTRIFLAKGNFIFMEESSRLVLVEKNERDGVQQTVVGFKEGRIEGEIDSAVSERSEIIFKLPQLWIKVKSSLEKGAKKVFKLSLTDNNVKVHVEKGEVEIITQANKIILKESESIDKKVELISEEKNYNFMDQSSPPIFNIKNEDIISSITKDSKQVIEFEGKGPKAKNRKKKKLVNNELNFFRIIDPKPGQIFSKKSITVRGLVPKSQKVYFKGKEVKSIKGRFILKVQLKPGENLLTFQIIEGNRVSYTSIGVERK